MLYRLVRPMQRKGSRNAYFQQRIPADVKQAAAGRRFDFQVGEETVTVAVAQGANAIKFSLRSSDPAEVKVRQAGAVRQAELHWKALRQTKPASLTHRQCVALAGRAYHAWASEERRETTTAMVWVPLQYQPGEPAREGRWELTEGQTMDGESGAWFAAARSVDPEKLSPLADRLLLAEGIGGVDDASREMLLNELAKALRQGFKARQRNAEGDYGPDPMATRFPVFEGHRQKADDTGVSRVRRSSSPPKVSLMGLAEDWWREAKAGGMSLSTYESYRNTARKLGGFLKHDDAGRVSAEDVIRFKDRRIADGVSPWAVKAKDIAGLRMVLAWGVANRKLASNPAEGVKVTASKRAMKKLRGFTDEEARNLLTSGDALCPGSARAFEDDGVEALGGLVSISAEN